MVSTDFEYNPLDFTEGQT